MVCGLPISPHRQSVNACVLDELEEPSGDPNVRKTNQEVIHMWLQSNYVKVSREGEMLEGVSLLGK